MPDEIMNVWEAWSDIEDAEVKADLALLKYKRVLDGDQERRIGWI